MVVSEFNYIGRVLTALDDDWPVLVVNLSKAQKRWVWVSRVLGREVSDPRNSGIFYKTAVQETELFCAESG